MGTHPIFESDFDCLTEILGPVKRLPDVKRDSVRGSCWERIFDTINQVLSACIADEENTSTLKYREKLKKATLLIKYCQLAVKKSEYEETGESVEKWKFILQLLMKT